MKVLPPQLPAWVGPSSLGGTAGAQAETGCREHRGMWRPHVENVRGTQKALGDTEHCFSEGLSQRWVFLAA